MRPIYSPEFIAAQRLDSDEQHRTKLVAIVAAGALASPLRVPLSGEAAIDLAEKMVTKIIDNSEKRLAEKEHA